MLTHFHQEKAHFARWARQEVQNAMQIVKTLRSQNRDLHATVAQQAFRLPKPSKGRYGTMNGRFKHGAYSRVRDRNRSLRWQGAAVLESVLTNSTSQLSSTELLVEACRQHSFVHPQLIGKLTDVLGRGASVTIRKDRLGRDYLEKSNLMSMSEMEHFVLRTRGKRSQVSLLAKMGVAHKYGKFHVHMLSKVS